MKVYFDLDGVLADFGRGVSELLHQQVYDQETATKESDDALWAGVRDCPHFYDRLEPMPGAVELFRMAHDILGEDCQILSAIPKPHRGILTAAEDKINWVHRLLGEDVVVNIVYRAEKKNFCTGPDCILVDDMQKNVTEWETCGGTGIVFRDAEKAKKLLEFYLAEYGFMDTPSDAPDALVERAKAIVAQAHRNQVDKAGEPYIGHLTSVAELVVTNKEKCVALMHDLFEDTDFSCKIVRKTFGNEIYQAMLTMTHREGVPYMDYVRNIRQTPLARAVKLADLTNNMDLSRLPEVTGKDLLRVEKYRQALQFLLEE